MIEQHAVRGYRPPANPAAQLVQLRQPEPFRILDDHQAGVGHIHPHLDDGGSDQQLQYACLELLHHPLFLDRTHPAVHQPDVQTGQQVLQLGGGILGSLALQHLRLLDQGADPVGLLALGAGELDPLDHVAATAVGQRHCGDGGSARRQFVDDRGVEVGIGGHRQGAGDGGGGHDELMGMYPLPLPFLAQGEALMHPESVLFIDDDQRQTLEHHLLLKDGVGAHHHLDAAIGDGGQRLLPRLAFLFARQPADSDAERFQPLGKVDGVLFRQQLGRRHQAHLTAIADSLQGSECRDQGLAGTHIPLHQPHHGVALLQILTYLGHHPALGTGRLERQGAEQLFDQLGHRFEGAGQLGLRLSAHLEYREVVSQQLFHH